MLDELERDIFNADLECALAAVAQVEQHGKERFMPPVNFFQFLGIDRQRDANLVGP